MAVPFVMPRLFGIPGINSFQPAMYLKAQNATFKQGDFLKQVTTGSIVNPNPNGSIATAAGPLMPNQAGSPVTITNVTSSGAAAATYYIILTYVGAGSIESLPSAEYLFNSPAGFVPRVVVTSVGAPANSTGTALYVGLLPGSEAQQIASTNFGSNANTPNPLTNYLGVNQCATNDNANIVGIALHDSSATWAVGPGGSALVGGNANILGATANPPPIGDPGNFGVIVARLIASAPFVISLKQAYYTNIVSAGLTLDSTTGMFIADTSQSNKIITIQSALDMIDTSNSSGGVNIPGVGVAGRQVLGFLNTGAI